MNHLYALDILLYLFNINERKTELLRMYATITASVSKDLLQRYKLSQEQPDNFVLTPALQLQVHIIVETPYLHRRTR